MKATLLALALLAGSTGVVLADGIFPECDGGPCDMSCNNMGGCAGGSPSCDARRSGAVQSTSVGSSLALLAFVSYRVSRRRKSR